MDQSWMGRYRPLVAALVRHTNINAKRMNTKLPVGEGVFLTMHEWQVLEGILENDENHPMIQISSRLAIPQSSFSKIAASLQRQGLVEKYQLTGNKKNVILKVTEKGRHVYKARSAEMDRQMFGTLFHALEGMDDQSLDHFVGALEQFNDALSAQQQKEDSGELVKLPDERARRGRKAGGARKP